MNSDENTTRAAFDTARDKRAHDIEHLSQEQQERVADIRRAADRERSDEREKQAQQRDRDIAEERATILREHPELVLKPDGATSRTLSNDEVDRMAEHAVDRRYCLEITSIAVAAESAIDSILREDGQSRDATASRSAEDSADHEAGPEHGTFHSPSTERDGGRGR